MKIVGVIPARMLSRRFPGKPLHMICGMPMVEHVYKRAGMFKRWDGLYLATCDREIAAFGEARGWSTLMTSDKHTRALDRVAEAAGKCPISLSPDDIIVNVQGDEPMLQPDMIDAVIAPLLKDSDARCTMLGMEIVEEEVFRNPDTLKIVHDMRGRVLFTSRAPVPHCWTFPPKPLPLRIYGIFAFRWEFLIQFTNIPESPLEIAESCDSNRILDNGLRQDVAPYPYIRSYSVDSPADSERVERHMRQDPLWGKY